MFNPQPLTHPPFAVASSTPLSPAVSSFQVSWLGLEENPDDPCKFTLTSRSTSGGQERYSLHSPSSAVSQLWVHQVSQILENQRNFLNGKEMLDPTEHQTLP